MDQNRESTRLDGALSDAPAITAPGNGRVPVAINALLAIAFLYLFLCSLKIMGSGLKSVSKEPGAADQIQSFFSHADNPFVALTAAVLVTALVQSSSFTTSLIITLVGAGQLDVETGVFAVMGANIGTSVTSTIAALGSVRIKKQFRRAFAAAIVHDFFNLLSVAVLFPLEWIVMALTGEGPIARVTGFVAGRLGLDASQEGADPVKAICAPVVHVAEWIVGLLPVGPIAGGLVMAVLGIALLLISLALMVTNLKGALLKRIEGVFTKVFFRNDAIAYVTGAVVTVLVQSSSITTSLIVPLAGAGTVKLKRVFPYVLGANLGTTMTGLLAATASPVPAAVTVAIAHVLFNLGGAAIWYPMRIVPIRMAKNYARLAAERKRYALLFIAVVFGVIPGIGLVITELLV